MKKYSLAFFLLALSFVIAFVSCKKINEATELGGDLIPAVDNVHTFEVALNAETKNAPFNDTSRLLYTDNVALGSLNDPDFGQTKANIYFRISSATYTTYPFLIDRNATNYLDSLVIDSVVLSLAYAGSYGDTQAIQTVDVYEIPQTSTFNDTTLYQFTAAEPTPAPTNLLGSKTFAIKDLNDTFLFARKRDTAKLVNVLRIKLNNNGVNLAKRIASFGPDLSPTGGFYSDSVFKTLVKGIAVKSSSASGLGGLAYFNLADISNTGLTVYFQAKKNGTRDTAAVNFIHLTNGQANLINRNNSGSYAAYLGSNLGDKIYLQSSPGSYASIRIPGLDTFKNKVVHRAEIIATRIQVGGTESILTPPSRLIIDHINKTHDTAFLLHNDLVAALDGSIGFSVFGGTLGTDQTYRFNITRHVQGIITRHEPNDTLRLYAPLRTVLFAKNLATAATPTGSYIAVPVISQIASGRVILGGGTYPDANVRLRLRIIYSNL